MLTKISTKHLGPVYGPLDEDCLPILGMPFFHEFVTGEWNINRWPKFDDIAILDPGFGNLLSISLVDGDFECRGQEFDPPLPALWSPADCKTIINLFKNGKKEFPNIRVYLDEEDASAYKYRSFDPSWLEKDDFGKTFFCINYWLNALVKNPEKFRIANDKYASIDHIEMAKIFTDNLTSLKKTVQNIEDIHPIISPGNMFMTFKNTGKDSNGHDTCFLNFEALELKFMIMYGEDGSYAVHDELSAEYNRLFNTFIYDLLPVFKRYNLISSMYYGIKYIIDQGLRPVYYL